MEDPDVFRGTFRKTEAEGMSLQEFEEVLAPAVFRMPLQVLSKPDGVPVQEEAAGERFKE